VNLVWLKKQPKLLYTLAALVGIGGIFFCVMQTTKSTQIEKVEVADVQEEITTTAKQVPKVPESSIYIVKEGDTLGTIAEQYNIDVDTLQGANLKLGTNIYPGDQLVILPQKGLVYTADVGDTLWQIAHIYSVDIAVIMAANGKSNENLSIGEKIFIPGGKKTKEQERSLRTETPASRASSNRFIWPTQGEVTSGFGRRWGANHDGLDLANDIGTPIRAARSGRVTYAGWAKGYGRLVIIAHDQEYITLYGHLSKFIVDNGDYVTTGQNIAYMGNTGNSTGPHLHFEVRKNGTPINPYNVLP
jgi:LysM repeat protein